MARKRKSTSRIRPTDKRTSRVWKGIEIFFHKRVFSLMKDPKIGRAWLNSLYKCSDGIRLAICLVIDIDHSAIDPRTIAEMLDTVRTKPPDSRSAFAQAVEKHPDGKLFTCRICLAPSDPGKHRYLRIVDLWEFIDYYAGPTYHYSLSVEDEDAVYET